MDPAAANLLAFRYNAPRAVAATNPDAPPSVQAAQVATAHGIGLAERELRRNGIDADAAPHIARMAALLFLAAFDGSDVPAGVLFDALIDRCRREAWARGGLP